MNAVPAKLPRAATQELCRGCGLCCDGSLFWAVEVDAAEALPAPAKTHSAADGQLAQPCRFHQGGACSIYATRPHQCRAFVCDVLSAVQEGTRDLAWGRARIEAMRHLLAGLDDALPGEGALYGRAAAYLEDADSLPDDARLRARIAVYRDMIGDFRPLSDPAFTDPAPSDPPNPNAAP